MRDQIDFSPNFPSSLEAAIKARIFESRALHNLQDDAFPVKLHAVSDSQFDLWIAAPDKLPPSSRTLLISSTSSDHVYEWLETEFSEWCARTDKETRPPEIVDVFDGGSF